MKKHILAFAMLCLNICLLNSEHSFAQGFNSITTSDGVNIIAVGNSGKFYRSASGGATWVGFTQGALNMNCVTSYNNDVWIAANNGTVYKTLNTTAPLTSYTLGNSTNMNSIDFINASTGFACGDGGAVYKSVNGGVNWTLSNSGIGSAKLNSIAFRDADNGTAVGEAGFIYMTNNGGSSWNLQTSGTSKNLLNVKYFGSDIVLSGEYGTLLTNTGSGFISTATRTKTDIRGVTGTSINDVHICGGGGFIRNNKNGNTKFTNFEQNPMMANLVDIFYYDANKAWAVSSLNSVIIYTTNGGTTWSMPSSSTMTRTWVSKLTAGSGIGNNLCEHPNDRNTMFVVYGSTVYVSRNRGESWTSTATITGGGAAHSFYVSPLDTNIWITAITGSPDKIKRTTNHGATWTTVDSANFSNYGQPLEMDQNNPSTFYFAPDGGGFRRSTNNGASFTEISGNYPFRSPCDILVTWDSSNVIYVGDGVTGSGLAKIFKSINGGVNWTDMYTVTSSETPSLCNTVFDNSIAYSTEWGGSGFYKSTNYGNSWTLTGATGGSGWGSDVCHEDPTMVLKGTYGSPHWLTTNSGISFSSTSCGGGSGAGIIVPERGYLLAMQSGGLFKMSITYTDSAVTANVDVQSVSIGGTGVQYYPTATINPVGTVKNNNGAASATFTVTRTISPVGYTSTKTITNLAPSTSTNVTFDVWTFNSGTSYTVKDSVYMIGDTDPANDILSGTLTPYVGTTSQIGEGFTQVAFPPSGWNIIFTGTNYWTRNTVSSYGIGVGSAKFNYFSASVGTVQSLESNLFGAPTISGDSLTFHNAYAPYTDGSIDSLSIEASSNAGSSFSNVVRLWGAQAGGPLNTAPAQSGAYTPTTSQWQIKKYALPVGTNKIRFRARSGFGNNLYIDSVQIGTANLFTQFNVKVIPQGLYNGSSKNLRDTVKVFLRNSISPFNKVDSSITIIDSNTLVAPCVFQNAPSGTYYLQVIHRNSIETWSKSGGETFTRGLKGNYDFTTSQSQAYGNNMILISGKYCIYSGDANQDGIVDGTDLIMIDNDAYNFASGYIVTDLNGDGIVDGSDLVIADNNAANFIAKITPESSPPDLKKESIMLRNVEDESKK